MLNQLIVTKNSQKKKKNSIVSCIILHKHIWGCARASRLASGLCLCYKSFVSIHYCGPNKRFDLTEFWVSKWIC